ncbi:MAG TPA: LpqB family beta-propeller domain-containing protein [Longimicrobiales bacterium]
MDPMRAFAGRRAGLGLLLLGLAACGGDSPTDPPGGPPDGTGEPATLVVTPGSLAFDALGDSAQLAAAVRDSAGTEVAGAAVLWASLDPTVATVSRSGWVRALANGTAGVVASAAGAADTVAVTVAQAVATFEVSPSAVSVAVGDTVRLVAAAADPNGAAVEGAAVEWTSADEGVATVDGSGLVTGVGGGETRITAVAGGGSDEVVVSVPDQIMFIGNRDGNYEIYVMNVDGSGLENLTNDPATDYYPVWSPDGTKIAFVSDRDGNVEIYVMNADGSGQTNLTKHTGGDGFPVWSPDGSRIAFVSQRDGNKEIYVMNVDGSGQTNLTNDPATDAEAAWSPDGTKIAFVSDRDGNVEIYVMNADGSGLTNLTNDPAMNANPAFNAAPAWSPDGTKIAFLSDRGTRVPGGSVDIHVMNADGSGVVNITNHSGNGFEPSWRPRP